MRPRKRVLCLDSDEDDLGVLTFLLETSGFRAIKATCISEAANVLLREPVEMVIVSAATRIDDAIVSVKILKGIYSEIPLALLCNKRDLSEKFHLADMAISRVDCSSAELLERIRILTVRKRGPKKIMVPVVPAPDVLPLSVAEAHS